MRIFIGLFLFVIFCNSCSNQPENSSQPETSVAESDPFKVEELAPWCILGFDSLDRTPTQRIAMLKEMGFTKYGFNKGKGHVHEMIEEFKLAKENDIDIISTFLWLNANRDSLGNLSASNQALLKNLKEVEQKPTIWVSFNNNFFEDLTDEASIDRAVKMIKYVKSKADEIGCKLALYNHHGWFGDPYHQIEIIEAINPDSLTMVYNFHHGHDHVEDFSEIVKKMKPYLSYVNLNGVKKDAPKILPIGAGDHEFDMIKTLQKEGYNGPWGILGHIKTDDVQVVLQRNLDGLKSLESKK